MCGWLYLEETEPFLSIRYNTHARHHKQCTPSFSIWQLNANWLVEAKVLDIKSSHAYDYVEFTLERR